MSFVVELAGSATTRKVVVENDGRTCYAYLFDGDEITSDVWICNVVSLPDHPWSDPGDIPFPNRAELSRVEQTVVSDASLLRVSFEGDDADVFYDDKLVARLRSGMKPAWSTNASKDGPLALALPQQER